MAGVSSEIHHSELEVQVRPEDIERTLKQSRAERAAGRGQGASELHPSIILSNFIVTLPGDIKDSRQAVESLLAELSLTVPSRFFIISLDSASNERLTTAVRCRLSTPDSYSEEIYIQASKETLPLVSSLLRSLCISDVSTVSYVMGEPWATDGDSQMAQSIEGLLTQLQDMCDLFLYDSRTFRNYKDSVSSLFSLRRIVRPVNEEASHKLARSTVRVRDLNWYRSEQLRSLLAEVFDAGEFGREGYSIQSVEVISSNSKPDATSLLLAGWLKEILRSETGDANVKFVSQKPKKNQGHFLKLLVKTDGLEFSVAQYEQMFEVSIGENSRRLTAREQSIAQLISLPMHSSGLDDYFTRSLERSLEIAALWV